MSPFDCMEDLLNILHQKVKLTIENVEQKLRDDEALELKTKEVDKFIESL